MSFHSASARRRWPRRCQLTQSSGGQVQISRQRGFRIVIGVSDLENRGCGPSEARQRQDGQEREQYGG